MSSQLGRASNGDLGGIGLPADLLRDVRLDGSVVLALTEPSSDADAVEAISAAEGWRLVKATEVDAVRWATSIQKTSLVLIATEVASFAIEVAGAVRRGATAPVVVVGDLDPDSRARVVSEGADMVLPAGLDDRELRSRILALLRRATETWEPSIRLLSAGELQVDLWSRTCTVGPRSVALSPTEFQLLAFLMRHPHQALSSHKIVQRVWGTSLGSDLNALRIHVSRLRRKITGGGTVAESLIRAVRGIGYEFTESVLEVGDGTTGDRSDPRALALGERLIDVGRALPLHSEDAAAAYITETLVASAGCDAAAIFKRRTDRMELVAQEGNSKRWRSAMSKGVPLRSNFAQVHATETRKPTQVADIQLGPHRYSETAKVLADDGFHSCLFVPILTDGGSWGGLGLATRSSRPFDPVVTTFCSAMTSLFTTVVRSVGDDALAGAGAKR